MCAHICLQFIKHVLPFLDHANLAIFITKGTSELKQCDQWSYVNTAVKHHRCCGLQCIMVTDHHALYTTTPMMLHSGAHLSTILTFRQRNGNTTYHCNNIFIKEFSRILWWKVKQRKSSVRHGVMYSSLRFTLSLYHLWLNF